MKKEVTPETPIAKALQITVTGVGIRIFVHNMILNKESGCV